MPAGVIEVHSYAALLCDLCAIDWQNALEKSSITNGNFLTFAKKGGEKKGKKLPFVSIWVGAGVCVCVCVVGIFMSQLINKINFI